jgi:hypothetical protein
MGKGIKIAIGCLVALLLACIVAIVVMVFVGKGAWNIFGGVAKDAMAIQKLDETYKFSEPSDGLVPEERLEAYIEVCALVRPEVEKLQAFSKSREGAKEGSWSDAKDALKLTTGLTTAMRKGLEEQKMSPAEFHFVGNAMRSARIAVESAGEGQTLDPAQRKMKEEMLARIEGILANPSLPQEEREENQRMVDQIRQELEATPDVDPNGALYLKHRERLDTVDLEGMEGVAFQGAASAK